MQRLVVFITLKLCNQKLISSFQKLAWSCIGLSGSKTCTRSEISLSHHLYLHRLLNLLLTLDSEYRQKHGGGALDMQKWSSASRLAPDGAPRPQCSTEDFELKAALEKSSKRREELIQRLQQTRSHLDAQTDLLKTRDTQLQQSHNISQFLELKHKVHL